MLRIPCNCLFGRITEGIQKESAHTRIFTDNEKKCIRLSYYRMAFQISLVLKDMGHNIKSERSLKHAKFTTDKTEICQKTLKTSTKTLVRSTEKAVCGLLVLQSVTIYWFYGCFSNISLTMINWCCLFCPRPTNQTSGGGVGRALIHFRLPIEQLSFANNLANIAGC